MTPFTPDVLAALTAAAKAVSLAPAALLALYQAEGIIAEPAGALSPLRACRPSFASPPFSTPNSRPRSAPRPSNSAWRRRCGVAPVMPTRVPPSAASPAASG